MLGRGVAGPNDGLPHDAALARGAPRGRLDRQGVGEFRPGGQGQAAADLRLGVRPARGRPVHVSGHRRLGEGAGPAARAEAAVRGGPGPHAQGEGRRQVELGDARRPDGPPEAVRRRGRLLHAVLPRPPLRSPSARRGRGRRPAGARVVEARPLQHAGPAPARGQPGAQAVVLPDQGGPQGARGEPEQQARQRGLHQHRRPVEGQELGEAFIGRGEGVQVQHELHFFPDE
mmetsp:Transcript_84963/g.259435  ORF Transcript_84963/g.259435 Transcript_84963/m.259435 type:complete len:230 (+) Transcript_84963:279-968(+)